MNKALRQGGGAHSRNKGATFEREIASVLFSQLGITFKRELEQYRAGEKGDLVPSNPDFPFSIECKRYASGAGCLPAWRVQSVAAATATGKRPAVIYRFDRQSTRVSVPLSALCAAWPADQWADLTLEGFCFLARELMASPGAWVPNDYRDLRDRIVGEVAE